ncbi:MAG TPA: LuxR C-terminal-related transcriptional regulator [Solirubrobacteraceae bacterium]
MPTRLVLIEDQLALRTGLALLLSERGCEVVGSTAAPVDAAALVARLAADVALIGAHVGGEGGGIGLTRRLSLECPACAVVVYAGAADGALLDAGLAAGARAVALAGGEIDQLADAIHAAAAGRPSAGTPPRAPTLSKRERQVVDLLAQGLTNEQVADLLVISAETVKTHIRNAMTKLEASTRAHAVALALRDGEISAPPPFVAGIAPARAPGVAARYAAR